MNHTAPINPDASYRRPRRRRGNDTIRKHRLPICPTTGKVRYRGREQANDGLSSAKWQKRRDLRNGKETRRHETRAYRCPECAGWHTTSKKTWIDHEPANAAAPAFA